MHERLKELRITLNLSQQKFADKLGIARGNIGAYEVNKNSPSDAVIALICKQFNVNESWLRTGNGEMFNPISKDDEIADMISDVVKSDEKDFKRRLISALARLDDTGWENLEKLIDMISENK